MGILPSLLSQYLPTRSSLKIMTLLTLIVSFLCGCSKTTSPSNAILLTTFILADTLGQAVTQFHSGEDFILSFSVTNTTRDTVTYHSGGPFVAFQILKGDSVVASSDYECPEPQIFITGHLAPGQSIQSSWRGPKSICQSQSISLSLGSYQARVYFPSFDQVTVMPVSALTMSIIQ